MLRRLLIRMVMPWAWRWSPQRRGVVLGRFAITEMDSAWQSLVAWQGIADPDLRVQLFQHALEEVDHAARFGREFRRCSALPAPVTSQERRKLFDARAGQRGVIEFFAYECVGERQIHAEFASHARAAGDPGITAVFESVARDEAGHVTYTDAVLRSLVGGDVRQHRRAVSRARWRRRWEAWLRLGRGIGLVPTTVILATLYFAFGLLLRARARRLLGESSRR